jgi:hypothetical protein
MSLAQFRKRFSNARCGKVYYHKDLAFWACEGIIVVQDQRPDKHDFKTLFVKDFEQRRDELKHLVRDYRLGTPWQRKEYKLVIQACADMDECIKEAKYMGDPTSPEFEAHFMKHRSRIGTTSVKLSAGSDPAGYPELPQLPRGQFRPDRQVPPDLTQADVAGAIKLHQPPRRKASRIIVTEL